MIKTPAPLTLIILLFLLNTAIANAQFEEGVTVLNVGVGTGKIYNEGKGASLPLFTIFYDKAAKTIGKGWAGTLGYGMALSYQHTSGYSYQYQGYPAYSPAWNGLFAGLRGSWHPDLSNYLNSEIFDFYVAVDAGYLFVNSIIGEDSYNPDPVTAHITRSAPWAGIAIGGRYYYNGNVGIFLEAGCDQTILKAGLCIQIKKQ